MKKYIDTLPQEIILKIILYLNNPLINKECFYYFLESKIFYLKLISLTDVSFIICFNEYIINFDLEYFNIIIFKNNHFGENMHKEVNLNQLINKLIKNRFLFFKIKYINIYEYKNNQKSIVNILNQSYFEFKTFFDYILFFYKFINYNKNKEYLKIYYHIDIHKVKRISKDVKTLILKYIKKKQEIS